MFHNRFLKSSLWGLPTTEKINQLMLTYTMTISQKVTQLFIAHKTL